MSSVHASRRVIGLHRVGENGLAEVTTGPMGLTVNSPERMVYVFHLLHRSDHAAEQPTHHSRGGAPVPDKTDETVTHVKDVRTKLIAGVAVSTPTGVFMTWLAADGEIEPALLRPVWSLAEVAWVALIACICTLVLLAQRGRDMRYQKERFDKFKKDQKEAFAEFERRRDNSLQVFIEETAERTAERLAEELKLEQLNSEYRKLN